MEARYWRSYLAVPVGPYVIRCDWIASRHLACNNRNIPPVGYVEQRIGAEEHIDTKTIRCQRFFLIVESTDRSNSVGWVQVGQRPMELGEFDELGDALGNIRARIDLKFVLGAALIRFL
jgi:hypothetical protein